MKKLFLILAGMFCMMGVNAQAHFVGGIISVWSDEYESEAEYTNIEISPKYGYNFNAKWAAGITVSYLYGEYKTEKNIKDSYDGYGVKPFLRYKFLVNKPVVIFADMTLEYYMKKYEAYNTHTYGAMFRPGIAYIYNEHFSIAAYLLDMGYRYTNYPGARDVKSGGFDYSMNSLSFGLNYHF